MSIQAALVLLLHLAMAGAVTVHVLLRKRDVAAAISWIGLAWLSPVLGSLLYALLGINRVRRRARRLQRPRLAAEAPAPVSQPAGPMGTLETAIGRITRRPLVDGNGVRPLVCGDEGYPVMLAAIDGARSSVALAQYIFRADRIGLRFVEALGRARARGVTVRVLVDGIGSGYLRSPAYDALRRDGVPAARFLHSLLPWRMTFLNLRSHKKLLVIDGTRAFAGGLNIGDENLLAGQPAHPVHDLHFAIEGPVVGQLMADFAADWLFATGEQLAGAHWFPPPAPVGPARGRVITSGPDQDVEKRELVLMAALAAAQSSVRIASPYFLPDDRICTALALAALRGVAVDIIVPAHPSHPFLDWAFAAQIRPLLEAGCRVWRRAPPFEHAKLMTVDGAWALIGSGNWDVRSLRLNFELDLELHDPPLAARLDRIIEHGPREAIRLEALAAQPVWATLRDAAARLLLPYL